VHEEAGEETRVFERAGPTGVQVQLARRTGSVEQPDPGLRLDAGVQRDCPVARKAVVIGQPRHDDVDGFRAGGIAGPFRQLVRSAVDRAEHLVGRCRRPQSVLGVPHGDARHLDLGRDLDCCCVDGPQRLV
jgi:hypothetical protein